MKRSGKKFLPLLLAGFSCPIVAAYEVPISDNDYSSQICSGMWGGSNAYINVSFDADSQGQLAMVIYEWNDNAMLGKVTSTEDDSPPQKTYVCTSAAVRGGFCDTTQLGTFILDLPEGKSLNETSFWTARVGFRSENSTGSGGSKSAAEDILWYDQPIKYDVHKTGFYCVAVVPVTVLQTDVSSFGTRAPADVPLHPKYHATIMFKNTFNGQLPASEYPKVNFYLVMFLAYAVLAGVWGWLCFKYKEDLLPIQYYLSSLIGFLVIEMVANWAYYRYLNVHAGGPAAVVFLFVVAILDAGRNALSFFMLLVVSLGLSIVRQSLGKTMTKVRLLAIAHFIFGVLYAVGIVELELESTSGLILLLFVIPLAFTLSGFLLWIMYALNGTLSELAARKQRYKLTMFRRLHRILLSVVFVVAIFFVVSSFSFSYRLAEDFAARTWKYRWWLLDGWLALLYFAAFASVCYLWRPTLHNRRYVYLIRFSLAFVLTFTRVSTLAMSDELAQEDEDAEDYDLETIESRTRVRQDDDDDATLVASRRAPESIVGDDNIVFEIGDQDMSDEDEPKATERRYGSHPHSEDRHHGDDTERQGLIRGTDQ